MILVCLFYYSFSYVSNKYEKKADVYAAKVAGDSGNDSEIYNKAYQQYLKDMGKQPVYMGYTLDEVRKWGIGLGLDLKGGMNVILQVDMPDVLRSMKNAEPDTVFDAALTEAEHIVASHQSEDFVGTFISQYRQRNATADFSVIFNGIVDHGASDDAVRAKLKSEVKDRVDNSATNVLRNRIDQFGVVSPNIQVLQGKDGQILLELPGVKDHDRVRELLQRSANLEFFETYNKPDKDEGPAIFRQIEQLNNALTPDSANYGNKTLLGSFVTLTGLQGTPVVGYVSDESSRMAVDSMLNSPIAKNFLDANLKLRWGVKETPLGAKDSGVTGYALYALRSNAGAPALDGSCVVDASTNYETFSGNVVSMRMNSDGAKQWARITKNNIGSCIAIVLDDRVYSAPRVNNAIEGGSSQITGDFTLEEAKDLANVLKSGKMNAKINIISDMVIGPSLGQQSIQKGFVSFIVALVLLMIFMICFYGFIPGLIANLGLICNLFFTFGILAAYQAVLTMSGIAGIVLALGMAVDANVLIFERTKEELRSGKNIRTAIADGYSNAFSAIFDSNLTSIITGVILMYFGTGPIKGFATTLIIGLICSFFTAVYLTRIVFMWFSKTKAFQKMTFTTAMSRNFLTGVKFNFLGQRKKSLVVCCVVILVVLASFIFRGLNQGIDFSGGRNYVVKFEQPVSTTELQSLLAPEFPNSAVSVITIEHSNQVRISTNYKINDENPTVEKEIASKLYQTLKPYLRQEMTEREFSTTDASQGIISSQKVGPTVANDMKKAAYIAVALSLIAMFLYILIRFRNVAFSIGALAAVAFTAFTIIGFYSLFWGILPFAMEIDQTFIAAILTVIGYQINDTVVVFDRVRENLGLYPKHDRFTVINTSINSTLCRTLMTSCTTLLVLLVIFILGGDSIRSFIFAMIFGVIIGTCATIFVASPIAYVTDSQRRKSKENAIAKAK